MLDLDLPNLGPHHQDFKHFQICSKLILLWIKSSQVVVVFTSFQEELPEAVESL